MFFYVSLPFICWFLAGSLKFIINYLFHRNGAFSLIGNGGFPSTHTTVVSGMVFYIGLKEGVDTPFFGLGVTFLIITIIDALGIRRSLGKHAKIINIHTETMNSGEEKLRERQGHNIYEILGGLLLGFFIAIGIKIIN
ncbi:divergent PAP2 family protein [Paenibacillus oleatilyticus]|uniref:divergent PAP2 family protein n=1 Tax=Paenibacillus oleatilyticus TaxID=2594886 RepID=UPI001C1F5404|nr:divergent PAP2 family protein [Paenibacillus oleatilyticus]MBU7319740.1 divergent PAP2 family protein [Paenibacillus oleatilyticus]